MTSTARDRSPGAHAVRVFECRPGRLLTDDWLVVAVVDGEGNPVADATLDFRGSRWRRRLSWIAMRRASTLSTDRIASLLTGGGSELNYFHWLYDVLPRYELLRMAGMLTGEERFLVTRLQRPFQRQSLAMFGVPIDRLVEVEGPLVVHARALLATAGHRPGRTISPWLPRLLRQRLGSGDETTEATERLYVTRGDTRLRGIVNEDDLVDSLAKHGVRPVELGGMSVAAQVRLFERASLVVAAHGAGLTNITFCRPGTRVIELVGGWSASMYEEISRALGLDYTAVEALRPVPGRFAPAKVRDSVVDIAPVAVALARDGG